MPRMTPLHVWAYRRFDGRYGNTTTAGGPVLVISTIGRRSGLERSVALGYYEDADSRYIVGSNGGQAEEPGWALNLKADPSVEVQVGSDVVTTQAELLTGPARDAIWRKYTAAYPAYADAESWSGRTFPLFRLPKIDVLKEEQERT